MRKEYHNSIIITLSLATIRNRPGGLRQILTEWRSADGEASLWWYRIGHPPKEPDRILNVFWIINGRIRWHSRLLHVERTPGEMTFSDGRTLAGKSWLVLFDFNPIPRKMQIPMKGFQGFRYADSDALNAI